MSIYDNNKLLSRKQASDFLGIKEQTLASWLCKKSQPLKVVKIGKLCKYRFSDLLDFLEKQTIHCYSGLDIENKSIDQCNKDGAMNIKSLARQVLNSETTRRKMFLRNKDLFKRG